MIDTIDNERQLPPSDRTPKLFAHDEKTRARLMELRDAPGSEWSLQRLSKETGYSVSVLSRYLAEEGNGYAGDTISLERTINEFLRDQWLEMDSSVETIESDVSRQIHDAIEDVRTAKRIGVIIGDPGIGKTRGTGLYCASHERAISFVVCSWQKNQRAAEDCLFKAANVTRDGGTEALANRMRGSSRPIIIDDAHKLTGPALQFFYDFRDRTGSPVILVGTDKLLAKLRVDAQRLRRTGVKFELQVKDPRPLVLHHIKSLAPDGGGEEQRDLVELCVRIAGEAGRFGSVQMELALAARLKRGKPEWSWCEAVKRAHKRLIRDYNLEGKN